MNTTALITGASGGIGLELARIHAKKGGNLVLIARRQKELEKIKGDLEKEFKILVEIIAKDLTHENAAREIYDEIKNAGIKIGYLINNAGFGGYGKFHERNWEDDEKMIQLNILALSALTHLFLPEMVARNEGKILNVSSTAGFLPGPLMAVYYATKAYVNSFSQAIAQELSKTNVTITALCPGPVDTNFASTADLEGSNLFKSAKNPQAVAAFGYKAMMKGKLLAINERGLSFMLNWIVPFVPRKMVLMASNHLTIKK